MNPNFKQAVTAAKTIESRSGGLWTALVLFAGDVLKNNMGVACDISADFKKEEQQASTEMRYEVTKNSTYRSNKCVIVNAVEAGVSLFDSKGKPRGKTEVEKELKEGKEKKPAMSRFQTVLKSADTIADELLDSDCILAAALVQALLDKVAVRIRKAA